MNKNAITRGSQRRYYKSYDDQQVLKSIDMELKKASSIPY